VGIFPNEESVVRLAGSVLLDVYDEWQAAERRYFSESSMAKLNNERDNTSGSFAELEVAGAPH
jgi:putative transposase